jgi:hypothetical protein
LIKKVAGKPCQGFSLQFWIGLWIADCIQSGIHNFGLPVKVCLKYDSPDTMAKNDIPGCIDF